MRKCINEKIAWIFLSLMLTTNINAQQYVQMYYNPKLYAQITANHAVRIASEKLYQKSFENQSDNMEIVRDKTIQVIAMKEMIYSQLKNVNSALKQGKQLERLYFLCEKLVINMDILVELIANKPQYAILYTDVLEKMALHGVEAYQEVNEHVLKEDTDYLMDSYDRQALINMVYKRTMVINGYCLYLIRVLTNAEKKPYLRHVKIFNQWYIQDKAIINRIITNSGYLIN